MHLNFHSVLSGIRQVMASKSKWDQIVAIKTVKRLNGCWKTVENAWNKFQESGTTSGKQVPARMRTVRTKSLISIKKKKVERNPQKSVKNCKIYLNLTIFNTTGTFR